MILGGMVLSLLASIFLLQENANVVSYEQKQFEESKEVNKKSTNNNMPIDNEVPVENE